MTMREMKKQEQTNTEKHEEADYEREDVKACVIQQLPNRIVLEIFCRIPINTVGQCKCVCKSWRRSLSDPEFTKSLFARTQACLFLRDRTTQRSWSRDTNRRRGMPPNKHVLANLESVSSPNNMVLKLSDRNALYNRLHTNYTGIMGSCNGFLCLFRYNDKTDAFIFNISNPITRECIPLPVNEEIRSPLPDFGFGFSPTSDVYKVVVFANNRKRKKYCRDLKVMVLTVGSEIWRRIGKIRDTVRTTKGVFHEGHLHWVCGCNGYRPHFIRAFDVESERFKDLPMPPHYFNHSSIPELGVIGGSLSISDGSTFWIMKEYGVKASWTKVLEIGYDTIDSIIGNYTSSVEVLKVMEEGKVLLLADYKLWLYTPETKTLVRVEIDGLPSGSLSFVVDHIPSFLSLKDVIKDYNSNSKKRS